MSFNSDSTIDDGSESSLSIGRGALDASPVASTSGQSLYFPPELFKNTVCPAGCSSTIIVYNTDKQEANTDYVTAEFVEKFNKRIGDEGCIKKAKRLMSKMKKLGGLHPDSTPETINIPAARVGFAMLAGLNDHGLKMEALSHLEYILENDPITEYSCLRLLELTILVMHQLDRDLMQSEILEVQIKSAKIYGLLAELIQRHFVLEHINAITNELRFQLLKTASALDSLNRLEDVRLDFYVKLAREGIKRILSDNKRLFEMVDRLYNAVMLGLSIYLRDLSNAPQYTESAFFNLDITYKFPWYDASMTILKLGRQAMTDKTVLSALQVFVQKNASRLNWKFLYLAIDIFTNIALNSPDPEIRREAFSGKVFNDQFPGLIHYSKCNIFGKTINIHPIKHLERPKMRNDDAIIRLTIAKSLIKLSNEAPDQYTRQRARLEFLGCLEVETSKRVLKYMQKEFKKIQGHELAWVNEEPPFTYSPVNRLDDSDTTSITPRRIFNPVAYLQQGVNPRVPTSSSSDL